MGPVQDGQSQPKGGLMVGPNKTQISSSKDLPPVKPIPKKGTFPVADYSSWVHKTILVYGISLDSSLDFNVQLNGDETNKILDEIADYIERIPEVTQREPFEKVVGGPCLAVFPDDELWYRARIVQDLGGNVYEVKFVDYGDVARVKGEDMQKCPESFCDYVEGVTQAAIHGFTGNESVDEMNALRKLVTQNDLIATIQDLNFEIKGKTRMLLSLYDINLEPIKSVVNRMIASNKPSAATIVIPDDDDGQGHGQVKSVQVQQPEIFIPPTPFQSMPLIKPHPPVIIPVPASDPEPVKTSKFTEEVKPQSESKILQPQFLELKRLLEPSISAVPAARKIEILSAKDLTGIESGNEARLASSFIPSALTSAAFPGVKPKVEITPQNKSETATMKTVAEEPKVKVLTTHTEAPLSPALEWLANVQKSVKAETKFGLTDLGNRRAEIKLHEDSIDGSIITPKLIDHDLKRKVPESEDVEIKLNLLLKEKEAWDLEKSSMVSNHASEIESLKIENNKERHEFAECKAAFDREKATYLTELQKLSDERQDLNAKIESLKEILVRMDTEEQHKIAAAVKLCEARKEQEVTENLAELLQSTIAGKDDEITKLKNDIFILNSELQSKNEKIQSAENHNQKLRVDIQIWQDNLVLKEVELKEAQDALLEGEKKLRMCEEKERCLQIRFAMEKKLLADQNEELAEKLEALELEHKADLEKELMEQKVSLERELRDEIQRQYQMEDGRQTPLPMMMQVSTLMSMSKGDKSVGTNFDTAEESVIEDEQKIILNLSSTLTSCLKQSQKCQQKYKTMIAERDQEIVRLRALTPSSKDKD